MPELTLVPVAARVRFSAMEDRLVPDWPAVLRDFVAAIAARVGKAPQQVIGHIKGMVQLPGHLLRVNCVSASVPVETAGELPEDTRKITLEIVLLVYGLDLQSASEAIAAAAAQMQQACGCTVRPESAAVQVASRAHKTDLG